MIASILLDVLATATIVMVALEVRADHQYCRLRSLQELKCGHKIRDWRYNSVLILLVLGILIAFFCIFLPARWLLFGQSMICLSYSIAWALLQMLINELQRKLDE